MRTSLYYPIFFLVACGSSRPAADIPHPPSPPILMDPVAELSLHGTDAILWQYASAEAHRLFQQGYELARIRLEENLLERDGRPAAVIVDVDETVLDNSPYEMHLLNTSQVYTPATWKDWTARAEAKALPGSVEFLMHAAELGCEVFYITNRQLDEGPATLRNLEAQGFPFADEEHLMLMNEISDKTARRARVMETHQVVLVVGDQLRDMAEVFKDRSDEHGKVLVDNWADSLSQYFILLPNPIYGTYREVIHGRGEASDKLKNVKEFVKEHSY